MAIYLDKYKIIIEPLATSIILQAKDGLNILDKENNSITLKEEDDNG